MVCRHWSVDLRNFPDIYGNFACNEVRKLVTRNVFRMATAGPGRTTLAAVTARNIPRSDTAACSLYR